MKKILLLLILTTLFAFAQSQRANALSAKHLTRKARPGSETNDSSKKSTRKSKSTSGPTYQINRPRPSEAAQQPVTIQKPAPVNNQPAAEKAGPETGEKNWKKPAMYILIGLGGLLFFRWLL